MQNHAVRQRERQRLRDKETETVSDDLLVTIIVQQLE